MKTNLNYDQYIPTRILFGAGQLNNLHAQPMPSDRVQMTDEDIIRIFAESYK